MKHTPFYELQQQNPTRKPTWRWDRANDLVASERYLSKKRDDVPTGIVVSYLRDIARCYSDLRFKRVKKRYRHLHEAKRLWEAFDRRRLEIETRILARQTDVEIGYELELSASTIQAYRDVFFHVDDRIGAATYIMSQVIGYLPLYPPTPTTLMQACAYFHGPKMIEPWLMYLREGTDNIDLNSAIGRTIGKIDYLVAVHTLPDTAETRLRLVKLASILFKNAANYSKSVPAATAFANSMVGITSKLQFSASRLPLFSYQPTVGKTSAREIEPFKHEGRQVA